MAHSADVIAADAAEFSKLVSPDAAVRKLAGGMRFLEGPVWMPEGFLVFSDIPADEMKKWDGKEVTTFRKPSQNSNGNTLDREGRLVTCQHGTRTVTRTKANGSIETLAREFEGKRLNSPNDLAIKSDGSIWFTDPPYGLQGQKVGKELDKQHVFRIDPQTGTLTSVADDFVRPNGICFSPDEKRLYIADSAGRWDGQETRWVRVFDLAPDGKTLANGRIFCRIDNGIPDGMRVDERGNLWSSAGDGAHVFSPDGKLLGKVHTAETITNLCFGGAEGSTLFMTGAKGNLYSIETLVRGAARPAR